ncbi:MAG: 50S ribosomal protein L22 [Myxococcota bacterium]|nr:50S ribosomal protein L22 [Myxococcota bacterium]
MLQTSDNEVRASARFVRIAPRKARIAADMIRNKPVTEAIEILAFTKNRGAQVMRKVLDSAVASANEQNLGDLDNLIVSKVMVDKGPNSRRYRPRAMGRATRINKFTSHIHLFVADATR